MKKLNFALLIIALAQSYFVFAEPAKSVECEKISDFSRWVRVGTLKTCQMQQSTEISSYEVAISTAADENMKGLTFQGNKKVSVLPVKVSEKFPNLVVFDAGGCSLKQVYRENFKNLGKLQQLFMCCNQIEKIEDDTFRDLTSLNMLGLDKNKIKTINGESLSGLNNFVGVWLAGNDCIDENFFKSSDASAMITKVTQKCGFDDNKFAKFFNFTCGKVTFSNANAVGGTQTKRGEWPFLVALYNIEQAMFFCGGSLVTNQHVLTAAHCVKYKQQTETLLADELAILLGKYNLARVELDSNQIGVKEIRVHPDWRAFTDNYDADIAIVIMKKTVEFSQYIQPACLPKDDSVNTYLNGALVGWGKSEFTGSAKHEDIPRQIAIKAVNDSACFITNPRIAEIASLRTFCAGGNGIGPCNGDSGGGFFVKPKDSWMVKGIVSSSLSTGEFGCGVESFSVFTNVIKYRDWIYSVVAETAST